jgi:hypothetical protein
MVAYGEAQNQVSMADCASVGSPNWDTTRALPNSSSMANVSGAVLAQFLQPVTPHLQILVVKSTWEQT